MTETHTLQLQIDAKAADAGARKFAAAIATVRAAVQELDRDARGAFTALSKIKTPRPDLSGLKAAGTDAAKAVSQVDAAAARAATDIRRVMLAADAGLRQATTSAQKLSFRLGDLGDTAALSRLEDGLAALKAKLETPADLMGVREARNEYENLRIQITQAATAQENAIGIANRLSREQSDAAATAQKQADAADRLRREFVPLYAASKDYESVLDRIAQAERDSILTSAQAEGARQRATDAFAAASGQLDTFAGKSRTAAHAAQQIGFQLSDVAVMLQGGANPLTIMMTQGTQLAGTFDGLKSRTAILEALKGGFAAMLSPMALLSMGAIGLGAALYYGISAAIPPTKSFADALKDLDSALSKMKSSASEASDLDGLAAKYGTATAQVQALANAKRDLARLDAATAYKEAKESYYIENGYNKWWDSLRGFNGMEQGRVDKLAHDLDLAADQAKKLHDILVDAMTTEDVGRASDDFAAMRDLITQSAGGLDKLTDNQTTFLRNTLEMEDKARQFAALDMAKPVTDAKAATVDWSGVMTGLRTQAEGLLQALRDMAGLKINISAQGTTTPPVQRNGTPISSPLSGRLSNIQDVSGDLMPTPAVLRRTTGTTPAASVTPATFNTSLTITSTLQATAAAKDFNKALQDQLTAVTNDNSALSLLNAGQADNIDSARLMAQAMAANGGQIDAATLAMIRQIDAAKRLNVALQAAANDPVKAWLAAVPSWQQAGQTIEIGVLSSLSDSISQMAQTGTMDVKALGDNIVKTFADVVSSMAVKELVGMFGGNVSGSGAGGFNLGGLLSMVFPAHKEGGISTQPVGFASAPLSAFHNAPHYAEGTANTSGIPSVLHDNEAVIPLSKGRKVPVELAGGAGAGGSRVYAPTFNIQTPDADSFRASKRQILRDSAQAAARAMKDK